MTGIHCQTCNHWDMTPLHDLIKLVQFKCSKIQCTNEHFTLSTYETSPWMTSYTTVINNLSRISWIIYTVCSLWIYNIEHHLCISKAMTLYTFQEPFKPFEFICTHSVYIYITELSLTMVNSWHLKSIYRLMQLINPS